MRCSHCQEEFIGFEYKGLHLDLCPKCDTLWFDKDELRKAKDAKDEFIRWIDPDIWKEQHRFGLSRARKLCPRDEIPLYEIEYDNTDIVVDVCTRCGGVLLDKGEFDKIVEHLQKQVAQKSVFEYLKAIGEEALEVFTGTKGFREETGDLLMVTKLLFYRISSQFPILLDILKHLPR